MGRKPREHVAGALLPSPFSLRGLPQLDQVVLGGNDDEQRPRGGHDAPNLRGRASTEDRKREIDGTVGERKAAVGVRDDPGEIGRKPSREPDGVRRKIDAAPMDVPRREQPSGQRPLAAADVESGRRTRQSQRVDPGRKRGAKPVREAEREPSAPRGDRGVTIPGVERTAVMRLEQVEVAFARAVERVAARAEQPCVVSCQRL